MCWESCSGKGGHWCMNVTGDENSLERVSSWPEELI